MMRSLSVTFGQDSADEESMNQVQSSSGAPGDRAWWRGEMPTLLLLAAAVPAGGVLVAAVFAALSLLGLHVLPAGTAFVYGAAAILIPAAGAAWSLRPQRRGRHGHRASAPGAIARIPLTRRQEWTSMGALVGGIVGGYAVCLPAAAWLDDRGRSSDLVTGLLLAAPLVIGVAVRATYRRRAATRR